MKRSIEVLIQSTGEIAIDAIGFTGADCEKATQYLEEALGVAGAKRKKPEYHQSRKTTRQQRLGS